jgi:hypothetical protein
VGPPEKIRGIKQALGSGIFINLNRVAFLEIHRALPACSPIFTLNTMVLIFGCFPHFLVAAMFDVHISMLNGMAISFVVNNAFHNIILSAFNITLIIHILCNHIVGIFITTAIRNSIS